MKQQTLALAPSKILLPFITLALLLVTTVKAQESSEFQDVKAFVKVTNTRPVTFQIKDTKGNPIAGIPIKRGISYYEWSLGLFTPGHFLLQFKPHKTRYVGWTDHLGKTDENGILVIPASRLPLKKVASKVDVRYFANSAWIRENSDNIEDVALVVPGPLCSVGSEDLIDPNESQNPVIVECMVELN
jgi:hypothetical protein